MTDKLETGSIKQGDRVAIVGDPVAFYVFDECQCPPWSKWINGNLSLYHKLKQVYDKDKKAFTEQAKQLFQENKK